jgi:hypothetical protein
MFQPCTISELKHALRHPFASPGGYTLAFHTADGEQLCRECVKANFRAVVGEKLNPSWREQWRIEWIDVRWEGPDEYCAHCNRALPSEYGDPDEQPATKDPE